MNRKTARQLLLSRRPDGADDDSPQMRDALALARTIPVLESEARERRTFDGGSAASLDAISPASETLEKIAGTAESFAAHGHGHRLRLSAILAISVTFLFMLGAIAWHLLGRAGTFPDMAVTIATTGLNSNPALFENVNMDADALTDWFVLKGFDQFIPPPGLGKFPAVGARLFMIEDHWVAMALIDETRMCFFAFDAGSFDVDVLPRSLWHFKQVSGNSLAIRQDGSTCFLIWAPGSKEHLEAWIARTESGK